MDVASSQHRGHVSRKKCDGEGSSGFPPYRRASSPKSKATESKVLVRVRYVVDTFFGQLTDRCGLKRLWARDLWHVHNRLLRAFLMHTIGFLSNQQNQAPLLQLERLVS
jgi:hypothetical protein